MTANSIRIERFDHLVLTVADLDTSIAFYTAVFGMQVVRFAGDRKALTFGAQKINLHQKGREFEPKAAVPMPGSADLCLLSTTPMAEILARLDEAGVPVEEGPVSRTGAQEPIVSVYIRDPDGNLIEIANAATS